MQNEASKNKDNNNKVMGQAGTNQFVAKFSRVIVFRTIFMPSGSLNF